MSPKREEWKLDPASFVVVANRLPVDRVERPDGTADWRIRSIILAMGVLFLSQVAPGDHPVPDRGLFRGSANGDGASTAPSASR